MMRINRMAEVIHETAAAHGFWEKPRNFSEMLMLVVSELSESQEADRDGQDPVWYDHASAVCSCPTTVGPDSPLCDCIPKPEGAAVEIADAIIRCLDTIKGNWPDIDIERLILGKMAYNNSRPYKHGRKY